MNTLARPANPWHPWRHPGPWIAHVAFWHAYANWRAGRSGDYGAHGRTAQDVLTNYGIIWG